MRRYCIADISWEAHKWNRHHSIKRLADETLADEHHAKAPTARQAAEIFPGSLLQLVIERSLFQIFASVLLPYGVVHSSVSIAAAGFRRLGKCQKWGPPVIGLLTIPILPTLIDDTVESMVRSGMSYIWPQRAKND